MEPYYIMKTGGGYRADEELLKLLNSLPQTVTVISVISGRFGKYHGLDEENEQGYKIVLKRG